VTAYPSSLAAIGDSMTRAYNTNCPLSWTDCPANSWSTGTNTTVNSFYNRLLTVNPAIQGHVWNDAVSGAKVADLASSQAATAAGHSPDAVTVLIGANDACGGSTGVMTTVSSFQTDFTTTMDKLTSGAPSAKIRVSSIPDVYQLWVLFHNDPTAVSRWRTFNMCNALLWNATSTAQADVDRRAAFRQRVIDFNTVLANTCAKYTQCTFDNLAGFNTTFAKKDVSTNDYFHPSVSGQQLIAGTEWAVMGF
jgi:lysophospholipase L1-like esterase